MPTYIATADLPPDTWVGHGDDRRYLLRADEQGWLWPWFHQYDRWFHTLDPVRHTELWTVHDPARNGEIDSLNDHVRHIPTEGCGARGWCGHHPKPEPTCTCPPEGSRPHPVDACYWHGTVGP